MKRNREDIVAAAFAASGPGASFDPIRVQKLMFLIDREVAERIGGPFFHFRPYHYGPFDRTIYDVIGRLVAVGDARDDSSGPYPRYLLTKAGYRRGTAVLASFPDSVADYVARASRLGPADAVPPDARGDLSAAPRHGGEQRGPSPGVGATHPLAESVHSGYDPRIRYNRYDAPISRSGGWPGIRSGGDRSGLARRRRSSRRCDGRIRRVGTTLVSRRRRKRKRAEKRGVGRNNPTPPGSDGVPSETPKDVLVALLPHCRSLLKKSSRSHINRASRSRQVRCLLPASSEPTRTRCQARPTASLRWRRSNRSTGMYSNPCDSPRMPHAKRAASGWRSQS